MIPGGLAGGSVEYVVESVHEISPGTAVAVIDQTYLDKLGQPRDFDARHTHMYVLTLDIDDFTDTQAVATIARLTGGNFRLIQRLFAQIARVLSINDLSVITADVVEAASSTLVLGAT